MVSVYRFHHHLSRYVYLVCCNVFRLNELLNYVEGRVMSRSCGVVAELVEVNEGFGEWEDEWGVVSGGRV